MIFFILFYFFSFSRHYEALHRQVSDYFGVTQPLPIIAHKQLASHKHNHSLTITSPPHTIPSPRLRSRRVWRSSLLTRIDSVSVFSVLAILDHWPKLWVEFSSKSSNSFRCNFQAFWGNSICTSGAILKIIPVYRFGENPPIPQTLKSITLRIVKGLTSKHVLRALLVVFYGR